MNWKIDFRIAYNKLKHLEIGTYIACLGVVYIVFTHLWSHHLLIPTAIYCAAIVRELYNKYWEKKIFDWMDIFATTSVGMWIYFLFLVGMHFTGKLIY